MTGRGLRPRRQSASAAPVGALLPALEKAPTGIPGLDEILDGGLPRGRPTLVCGGAGAGKTLLALSFLVHGVQRFGEPGVLITFEENIREISQDVASLGFDLEGLVREGRMAVDYVHIERSEIEETGEYDLEGLFVRLGLAVGSVGAKRVVLDTIESLFGGFSNESILRAELRRLFRWLKDRGLTTIVTGERGSGNLTRQGLEEYVSDAVILLDHRVHEQISTRRLRVVKYRGSHHGTNEYPFLIDRDGILALPVTSLGLQHPALVERVSTGVPALDAMLDGHGYYRGSTVLVSGTAGTGKTSLAAHFVDAACRRGERCLHFLLEESPQQIVRNMRSIGLDLQQWIDRGLLTFSANRPSRFGLEQHLSAIYRAIHDTRPAVVVMDPITNLLSIGSQAEVQAMLTRLIDHLKTSRVTALFTSLTPGKTEQQQTETGISSLMDTWVLLSLTRVGRARRRDLTVLKSRGMPHSNEICDFVLTDKGFTVRTATAGRRHRTSGRRVRR
jgi:circadian clock protein KaiC